MPRELIFPLRRALKLTRLPNPINKKFPKLLLHLGSTQFTSLSSSLPFQHRRYPSQKLLFRRAFQTNGSLAMPHFIASIDTFELNHPFCKIPNHSASVFSLSPVSFMPCAAPTAENIFRRALSFVIFILRCRKINHSAHCSSKVRTSHVAPIFSSTKPQSFDTIPSP